MMRTSTGLRPTCLARKPGYRDHLVKTLSGWAGKKPDRTVKE
jgi:hypothetical protein